MKTNIFIPKRINIGFQARNDTYTKKLAYVIYFDQKGVLRKETSWQNWRDKKIEPIEHDNVPTSGFVLNKKVGDYTCDWNHRQAYVRVYDPRDFEFEITIENLLYILENTSSIKGKGLEGDFVYGWHGSDMVLIPTCSPDYQKIEEFSSVIHENKFLKPGELKVGLTYRNSRQEELVYMGKFDYFDYGGENRGKKFFFYNKSGRDGSYYLETMTSASKKITSIASDEVSPDFLNLFDRLEKCEYYSPVDDSKDEYGLYTFDEFCNKMKKGGWGLSFLAKEGQGYIERTFHANEDGLIERYLPSSVHGWNIPRKIETLTFEEAFNKEPLYYLNKYLTNGKHYRRKY